MADVLSVKIEKNNGGNMGALTIANSNYDFLETPLGPVPRIYDEFWTAKQRQMHSLHYSNSYRASFKPELPDFFIKKFTQAGDLVGDPFGGRGTTALQAALRGRIAISNDANPLSERIAYPKLNPVTLKEIEARLNEINLTKDADLSNEEDMSMFYHEDTYKELINLRNFLKTNRTDVDRFIEMTAVSRLHGHSKGFFSTYSFPQISIPKYRQAKINETRGIVPEYREIKSRIIKKAKDSLKSGELHRLQSISKEHRLTTGDARNLEGWEDESVKLVVTSPPFLNQVDYIQDTWIEGWFCGIEQENLEGKVIQTPNLNEWSTFISETLSELHRVIMPGGILAMEVGEVKHRGQVLNLDEIILGLVCSEKYNMHQFSMKEIYIQTQNFTKLANCFNVSNNKKGTNTNRILLMERL